MSIPDRTPSRRERAPSFTVDVLVALEELRVKLAACRGAENDLSGIARMPPQVVVRLERALIKAQAEVARARFDLDDALGSS